MSFQLPDVPDEYYFITAPQNVNWNKESSASEVLAYGTNNPYVNYGSTKLRKLTFGEALVEGFSAGREIENDVVNLEATMQMQLDAGSGYAAPYCWYAWAGNKCYGIYIVTSVKVKEEMRDMEGKATRAKVDVSLQEVPAYQVGSGQDLSSQAFTGRFSESTEETLVALQDAKVANGRGTAGVGPDGIAGTADDTPGGGRTPGSVRQDARAEGRVNATGIREAVTGN